MTKIVLIKRNSAIFLATLLILGTIATITSSVQAQPYYDGMDKDRDSDRNKQVSVSSLKCNNINVNVNGLELNVLPQFLSGVGLTAKTADEISDASSFSGNSDGSEFNDFRFICINNNNNTVIGAEEEPIDPCVECFTENLSPGQLNNLTNVLSNNDLRDLGGLCEALSDPTISNQEKITLLSDIFIDAGITIETDIDAVLRVLNCLDELGLIIPPPIGLPNSIR